MRQPADPYLVILRRSEGVPHRFHGVRVVNETSRRPTGNPPNFPVRWYECEVYQTADQFVLAINFRTVWGGEVDHLASHDVRADELLPILLEEYDPLARVKGFPDEPQFVERQANLLEYLEREWRLVSNAAVQALVDGGVV